MKCSNCGADLREGEHFCPVCGQAAESVETVQNAETTGTAWTQDSAQNPDDTKDVWAQTGTQSTVVPDLEDKKKKKGVKIGIAVAVAAVLVVGVAAGAKVAQKIRKLTMSTADYYQYVETKNRDANGELVFGYYDAVREAMVGASDAKSANIKLEISDTAKSLLSLTGADFSGFENLELDVVSGREKEEYSNQIKIRGNDNDLITMNTYMDTKGKKAYYQIPEFSESYLDVSAMFNEKETVESGEDDILGDSMNGISAGTNSGVVMSPLFPTYDYDKIFIETKDLKSIYERYTDILIKSAKNVKKSEVSCKAEDVTQKADNYKVTMNGKEVVSLTEELLKKLKEDKEIKKFIEGIDKTAYEKFTEDIEEVLGGINSEIKEDDFKVSLETFVSSDDKIFGRTLVIEDAGEKILVIKAVCPQDGDKFGYELSITDGEHKEYANLHGKGTLKNGVMNGEFVLGLDDSLNITGNEAVSLEKLLIIGFEDYDLSKWDKGEAKGTVTYSTEALAALANYSLQIEAEGSAKESKGTIKVMAGKDALVTIYVTSKSDTKPVSTKPSESATVYDVENEEDMLQYQSEMGDITTLLSDMQEKLGIDLSGLLGMLRTGTAGLGDDYSEDYGATIGEEDIYDEEIEDYLDEYELESGIE